MYNYCLICGREISYKRNYCEECVKKIPKKKELSNLDILSKYSSSRSRIKIHSEKLVREIAEELEKLSALKVKFILNESNQKLLDDKMSKITLFKDKLIESWHQTAREN